MVSPEVLGLIIVFYCEALFSPAAASLTAWKPLVLFIPFFSPPLFKLSIKLLSKILSQLSLLKMIPKLKLLENHTQYVGLRLKEMVKTFFNKRKWEVEMYVTAAEIALDAG